MAVARSGPLVLWRDGEAAVVPVRASAVRWALALAMALALARGWSHERPRHLRVGRRGHSRGRVR